MVARFDLGRLGKVCIYSSAFSSCSCFWTFKPSHVNPAKSLLENACTVGPCHAFIGTAHET